MRIQPIQRRSAKPHSHAVMVLFTLDDGLTDRVNLGPAR